MLVQNLFDSKIKVPRINSQYIILMRAPNSLLSIRNLGTQLYPRKIGFFLDAYKKATASQYGYLLIDMHPASRSYIRLRTCIFPGEAANIFIPKSGGVCRFLMYFTVFLFRCLIYKIIKKNGQHGCLLGQKLLTI
jgi:hypothetical protein